MTELLDSTPLIRGMEQLHTEYKQACIASGHDPRSLRFYMRSEVYVSLMFAGYALDSKGKHWVKVGAEFCQVRVTNVIPKRFGNSKINIHWRHVKEKELRAM